MLKLPYQFLALAILGLTTSGAHAQITEADFKQVNMDLDSNPNDLGKIELPSLCGKNRQEVPNVIYTIQPGDSVKVLTYPANAVIMSARDGGETLRLLWNLTAVGSAEESGVIIEFPAGQLGQIDMCCSANAQVKPGFSALTFLDIGTSSSVHADLSTVQTSLTLDISTSATAIFQLPANDTVVNAFAGTSALLEMVGNVTRLEASTSSTVLLQGSVNNPQASSVGTSAALQTLSCEGIDVSTSGVCNIAEDLGIVVDTDQALTAEGRTSCTYTSSSPSRFVAMAVVATSTVLATAMAVV